MIVRNESSVIERALDSVKDVIDYFVIVDTGSNDDTPERIIRFMERHGIVGEVHFRDWVNFGHNRQQALELAVAAARADWLLFIDADGQLVIDDSRFHETLEPGVSYRILEHLGSIQYAVPHLVDISATSWQWRGVVHEYLHSDPPVVFKTLPGVHLITSTSGGARSHSATREQKYLRDARMLEQELQRNPDDTRSRFYLAQSYRDAGHYRKAYKHYGKRVAMGGWAEEVYVAQCEKALLAIRLNMSHRDIVAEHLSAYSLRPSRAEALWQLASHCRTQGRHAEGYLFARTGKDIPLPDDILFVRKDVYQWRLLDEFAICAYWIGQFRESAEAGRRLLDEQRHDPADRPRLEQNLAYALAKLNTSH